MRAISEKTACDIRAGIKLHLSCTVHWRNADTNLAEIHEEMSELVDKQVNVQKESLKKTSGVHAKLPQAHEKVCDENETKK